MAGMTPKSYTLDEVTEDQLDYIAGVYADGDQPNCSQTIRRLIREKARALGYFVSGNGAPGKDVPQQETKSRQSR